MENDIVIQVDGLSKLFSLYERPSDRLKEALHLSGSKRHRDFFAIRNISFVVRQGESLGVIGRNGSGKSTLLKILAGVLTPTEGRVQVKGRVSSLLELGAGFNPQLTGLENIYLQGTLMGFSRKDMQGRIPAILAFADIGEFIRQPVKHYSSGMFVRLAFACAISVDPDILMVDEALAVGDIFFQNKCFRRLDELKRAGTTLLFVSHDIGTVKQLCTHALWLDRGVLNVCGEKEPVCRAYFNAGLAGTWNGADAVESSNEPERITDSADAGEGVVFPGIEREEKDDFISEDARILSFFICEAGQPPIRNLYVRQTYEFHLLGRFTRSLDRLIFGYTIENARGQTIVACNTSEREDTGISACAGEAIEVVFRFRLPPLCQGDYLVSPAIARGTQQQHTTLAWLHNALSLHIENPGNNMAVLNLDHQDEVRAYPAGTVRLSGGTPAK